MEITTEVITNLDKLIDLKLTRLNDIELYQLCVLFNEYVIGMYFYDDQIEVTIYDDNGDAVNHLINRDKLWIY